MYYAVDNQQIYLIKGRNLLIVYCIIHVEDSEIISFLLLLLLKSTYLFVRLLWVSVAAGSL